MSREQGPGGITVTGVGSVDVVPDIMRIGIGVSVLRDSVSTARSDAAALAGAVLASLQSSGIAKADIQSSRFSIHPEYRHTERRRILDGYRVSSELDVTVRDPGWAGEVIDRAVAAGGSDVVIDRIWFTVEDDRAALDEARARAWADVDHKATQLAELAGVTVGRPITISESPAPTPGPPPMRLAGMAEAATPIEAGMTSVSVTLHVRFEIVEG